MWGGILVHSLLRRFSLEPAWGGKRVRPRNHGHQYSRGGLHSHPFPVLRDSTTKDCFVFQRLRTFHSPLKFIRFANCLHIRKGRLQFPLTAWGRLGAGVLASSTARRGAEGPGEPRARGRPLGGMECWHNAPFSTQNKFCWLWHFDLMKD